ncbi:hypothetical protein AHAS_Ahas05G0091100 [Arachis hypogaea]
MAPRGPGRGRERDRTSTQESEINPNNPVNLMAALENMAAAMQATAEALGQQINNNGNGGREAQGPMTLATFLKVNPPKFKGTTNPTEADTWFQAMERALQAQLVPEEQCVEFATYLLTGEASHWWQGARRLLQQGNGLITWDAFQVEFYKKYFPNSARTAKELELLQLKQGAMSVSEYTDKFEELFRFSRMCQGAPGDFEEWKCIKYEGGLWSDILSSVAPMEIRTFSELVNKSRIAEGDTPTWILSGFYPYFIWAENDPPRVDALGAYASFFKKAPSTRARGVRVCADVLHPMPSHFPESCARVVPVLCLGRKCTHAYAWLTRTRRLGSWESGKSNLVCGVPSRIPIMSDRDVLQTLTCWALVTDAKEGFYSSRSGNQPVISRTVTECVSIVFTARMGCSHQPWVMPPDWLAVRVTAAQDIGKLVEVTETVSQASMITKYVYNHCHPLYLMRQFTGGREILHPAPTQFATNFIALQSILAQKDALKAMVTSREWTKPLVHVLRIVDGEDRAAMGFLYQAMNKAREDMVKRFQKRKRVVEPYLKILDSQFDKHKKIISGLLDVIERYAYGDADLNTKLTSEKRIFKNAEGDFGRMSAIRERSTVMPDQWWESYGCGAPNLQKLAIHVLSQTCSSSGCERNWSIFEHIHSKKRNRSEHQKLNDLVYVHYNLRLQQRNRMRKQSYDPICLDAFEDHSEWIMEDSSPFLTLEEVDALRNDLANMSLQSALDDLDELNLEDDRDDGEANNTPVKNANQNETNQDVAPDLSDEERYPDFEVTPWI